jgi:outer membrane receptor for Fe3+-dicitrate
MTQIIDKPDTDTSHRSQKNWVQPSQSKIYHNQKNLEMYFNVSQEYNTLQQAKLHT